MSIACGGKSFKVIKDNLEFYYINIHECANKLNLNASHILSCLQGKRKTHKGYKFEYYD